MKAWIDQTSRFAAVALLLLMMPGCKKKTYADVEMKDGEERCYIDTVYEYHDDYIKISVKNSPSTGKNLRLNDSACEFYTRTRASFQNFNLHFYHIDQEKIYGDVEICSRGKYYSQSFMDNILYYIENKCVKGELGQFKEIYEKKFAKNSYELLDSEMYFMPYSKIGAFSHFEGVIDRTNFYSIPLGLFVSSNSIKNDTINIVCVVDSINKNDKFILSQIQFCLSGYYPSLF